MSDNYYYEAEVPEMIVPAMVDVFASESEVFRLGTVFHRPPVEEVIEVLRSSWAQQQGWRETMPGIRFERDIGEELQLHFVVDPQQGDVRLIRHATAESTVDQRGQTQRLLESTVRDAVATAHQQLHQVIARASLLVQRKHAATLGKVVDVREEWVEPTRVRQTIRLFVANDVAADLGQVP